MRLKKMKKPYDGLPRYVKFIRIILLIALLGLSSELLLIGHFETGWQIAPLIFTALFSIVLIFLYSKETSLMFRVIQSLSVILIFLGVVGVLLHLKNNFDFEREMYPNESISFLLKRSITGALPILAPGVLVPIGLSGLLYLNLKSFCKQ